MNETALSQDKLLEKQVQPIFESTLTGGLSNILAAILAYLLLMNNHQHSEALVISILITVLSIIRILFSDRYLKQKAKSNLSFYLKSHFVLTLLIGICWGALALMQQSQQNQLIINIVFLMNFGLIAGSIATLSAWIPTYLAYMLPQSIAVFSVFVMQATQYSYYYYISFSLLFFTAIMISSSYSVNRGHRNELALTLKNKALIGDLNEEIDQRKMVQDLLEESKRDLEHKVDDRTKELVVTNKNLQNEILEKQQAEVNLEYIAYHDELTGLPNKALLIDRINQSIETASRYNNQLGILFLDLDRFKNINDSLGHKIGDALILEVSRRILQTVRKEDTVSRNAGDEFVIVIQRMASSDEAILVAKKIINNLTSIFEIESHKVHIGASIGISLYPNDGDTPLELIRNADTAMYKAKKSGGNRLQFYDESMSSQLRQRLDIENELHIALEKNEFYMVYQPQVDCITGQTIGFEALMRWKNDTLGEIGPDQFVPLLEETGLIYTVGEWVIEEVIKFIASGTAGGLSIAINLSTLQCKDISLIVHLQNEIRKTGTDPAQLEFEITESLLINDFDKTEIFLNELHSIGCSIALDDFGTGYTSMSYLTRLPIDIIKVDKSFIRNIDSDTTLYNIVKAITKMSASLGIINVYEGVETLKELDVIKQLNGSIVQGYLYSKPLRAHEVKNWLSTDKTQKLKLV